MAPSTLNKPRVRSPNLQNARVGGAARCWRRLEEPRVLVARRVGGVLLLLERLLVTLLRGGLVMHRQHLAGLRIHVHFLDALLARHHEVIGIDPPPAFLLELVP